MHVITTDDERDRALRMGAMGALVKPLKNRETLDEAFERITWFLAERPKTVIIADAEAGRRSTIEGLFTGAPVEIRSFGSAGGTMGALREHRPDLVVLGPGYPDLPRSELIENITRSPGFVDLPILAFSPSDVAPLDVLEVEQLALTRPLRDVRSLERLLDAAVLFLHLPVEQLPEQAQRTIREIREGRTDSRENES